MGLLSVDDVLTAGLLTVVMGDVPGAGDPDDPASIAAELQAEIDAGQDGLVDPDEGDEDDDTWRGPGKWSTADPYSYQLVRQYVIDNFFGGETQGMASLIGAFVNDWAETLADVTVHEDGSKEVRDWPSIDEIVASAQFQAGAAVLPYAGQLQSIIPPGTSSIFRQENEDGGVSFVRVEYDPQTGLNMEEVRDPGAAPASILSGGVAGADLIAQVQRWARGEEERPDVSQVPDSVLQSLDPEAQAGLGLEPTTTNIRGGTDRIYDMPTVRPWQDLIDAVTPPAPPSPSRRGSGAGPRLDWDRRKLTQMAEEAHRSWLFEDPGSGFTKSIVDGYINEATGFWKRSGGRILDYEAYVKEKLRATPRYRTIFRHKPDDVEEDQFIGQFAAPIASMGLRAETGRRQVEQSVTSGGSVQGQVTRVSRTREGLRSTGFAQRFARKLDEMGAGVRV